MADENTSKVIRLFLSWELQNSRQLLLRNTRNLLHVWYYRGFVQKPNFPAIMFYPFPMILIKHFDHDMAIETSCPVGPDYFWKLTNCKRCKDEKPKIEF